MQLADNTKALPAHNAHFLVKNCLVPIKLIYFLRCCRAYEHPELLKEFDERMRICLSEIANNNICGASWMQATLPVCLGGSGVRKAPELSLPGFLASAHAALALAQLIADFNLDVYLRDTVETWSSTAVGDPPEQNQRQNPQSWDLPRAKQVLEDLKVLLAHDPTSKARLLAIMTSESGAYLNALPVTSLSNFLDDKAFRIALALRLGIDTNAGHVCVCGQWADPKGYLALSCKQSLGRIPRHTILNNLIKRAFTAAGIFCDLEPQGLILSWPSTGQHNHYASSSGKLKTWDVTCVCTLAISHIAASSTKVGEDARDAESIKNDKYRQELPSYDFCAVGVETFRSWGKEASSFFKDIAARQFAANGERRSLESLRQRVSVEIQRVIAMSVLGTVLDYRLPVF